MPRPRKWSTDLEDFVTYCRERHLAHTTILKYRRTAREIFHAVLIPAGYTTIKSLDRRAVSLVLDYCGGKDWKFRYWRTFVEWAGCTIIKKMNIVFPRHQRINVDWLTEDQVRTCLEIIKDLPEDMMIHRMIWELEFMNLYRRIEVRRAKVEYFKNGFQEIHGKGRMGGKWRRIPIMPSTYPVLQKYLIWRKENIIKDLPDPGWLICYQRGGKIRPYGNTSLDNKLAELVAYINRYDPSIKFSHHTLRRTGGRMMWKAGVPIEVISQYMGHSDTKTTLLYLGINAMDMEAAAKQFHEFLNAPRWEHRTSFAVAHSSIARGSGGTGIAEQSGELYLRQMKKTRTY